MEEMIRKLPFISSAVMAVLCGIIGSLNNKSNNFIYASMIISILVFGFIGKMIKEFILKIENDNTTSKEDNIEESEDEPGIKGSTIDIKVDDSKNPEINDFYGEDFSPLKVSKVIKNNMENDK